MKLLTTGNPKTAKGEGHGYLTAILHLAPANLAGVGNVCPWASKGCTASCLNTAGRGGIIPRGETTNAIQEARKRKTRAFFGDRAAFLEQLDREIQNHARNAARHGLRAAVRLNGTSDLRWEKLAPWLFEYNPDVQFYDYTKGALRCTAAALAELPANYHLTFSRSESNEDAALQKLATGGANVAVVFAGRLPTEWRGFEVVNGDETDLRFLDPKGVVVGLLAKGRARRDTSGFVVVDH